MFAISDGTAQIAQSHRLSSGSFQHESSAGGGAYCHHLGTDIDI